MTEQEVRQRIVNIMQGWLSDTKKDPVGTHYKIVDIYNSHLPRARGYKVTYTDAWCATTVSAAAIQVGYTDIMPTECSCSQMIQLYKNIGRWEENDAYIPQPGDLILYDWDDNGIGDNTGAPEHIGMVVSVINNTITVIEGNKGNKVDTRSIKVNGRYIRGYCLPNYASKVQKEEEEMTQEQFNTMMNNYLTDLAKQPTSGWAVESINWAKEKGIMSGDQFGNMMALKPCNRQEVVTMLKRAIEGLKVGL